MSTCPRERARRPWLVNHSTSDNCRFYVQQETGDFGTGSFKNAALKQMSFHQQRFRLMSSPLERFNALISMADTFPETCYARRYEGLKVMAAERQQMGRASWDVGGNHGAGARQSSPATSHLRGVAAEDLRRRVDWSPV